MGMGRGDGVAGGGESELEVVAMAIELLYGPRASWGGSSMLMCYRRPINGVTHDLLPPPGGRCLLPQPPLCAKPDAAEQGSRTSVAIRRAMTRAGAAGSWPQSGTYMLPATCYCVHAGTTHAMPPCCQHNQQSYTFKAHCSASALPSPPRRSSLRMRQQRRRRALLPPSRASVVGCSRATCC